MEIREYKEKDIPAMIRIWNEVVEEGVAFPQEDCLDEESGKQFFAGQSYSAVAVEGETVVGLYILHSELCRPPGAYFKCQLCGELRLPRRAYRRKACNTHARHLYERLGFVQIGTLPGGFRMKNASFEDICLYYHEL